MFQVLKAPFLLAPMIMVKYHPVFLSSGGCVARWCPSCMRSKVSITLKDIQHNGTQHPGDGLSNTNCHTPRRRFLEDLRLTPRKRITNGININIIKTSKTQGFYMVSQCCVKLGFLQCSQ